MSVMTTATANADAAFLGALFNGGKLHVYRQASQSDGPGDDIIATFTLESPAFEAGGLSGEVVALGLPKSTAILQSAQVSYARIVDSAGTPTDVLTLTVGLPGSGADAIFDTLHVQAGRSLSLISLSLRRSPNLALA